MDKIDKKIVVGHLDTKCDRQLFLSIMNHGGKTNLSDSERDHLQIPDKYKLRTRGISISQSQGKKLEDTYYKIIKHNFANSFHHFHDANSKDQCRSEKAFLSACQSGLTKNLFALEVSFNTHSFMSDFYQKIGLSAEKSFELPHLGFMRPDIILATQAAALRTGDEPIYEVMPDGDISLLDTSDSRTCLFICDVKLAEEASISQFSEAALYSWMLSNWLQFHGLANQYVVVDSIGIWTNDIYVQNGNITDVDFEGETVPNKLAFWLNAVSKRTFDQYVSAIKHVLVESIPRVLGKKEDWQSLEYHVSPGCELCDFLGRMDQEKSAYVNPETKEVDYRHFDNLCAHKAYENKHLSIVPGVTKGARRALEQAGVANANELVNCAPEIFRNHSALKKQSHRIPEKTQAILKREKPDFFNSKNISLARSPNLGIMFHVNYDISNGLAASFAVQGAYYPVLTKEELKDFDPSLLTLWEAETFVVENISFSEEVKNLKAFLRTIEEMFDFATDKKNNPSSAFNMEKVGERPTVQFYCWDRYQLDFMKKILARHLDILLLEDFSRSLIWLFSPDDLIDDPAFFRSIGKGGRLIAPYICVLKDIVQENGKWPIETTYPLFLVASMIDAKFALSYKKTSWLHKSQLGDYIPRERILEIWLKVLGKSDVYRKALSELKTLNTNTVDPELISTLRTLDVKKLSSKELKKYGELFLDALPSSETQLVRDWVYNDYLKRYRKSARNQTWAVATCRKFIGKNTNVEKLAYPAPVMMETMLDRQQVFTKASIKSLPADSQIWIVFAILDDQFALFEYYSEIASSILSLESKYSCIVVSKELTGQELKNHNYQAFGTIRYFWVTEDSKNCKIREGDSFLTLLLRDLPGFAFQRPSDVIRAAKDEELTKYYEQNFERHVLYRRFLDLINVEVKSFDRINGIVGLSIDWRTNVINQLLSDGLIQFESNIAVARSAPLKRNHVTLRCLKQIGHPTIAHADSSSRKALLKNKKEVPNKMQETTRAAQILWRADELNTPIKSLKRADMKRYLEFVSQSSGRYLPNDSQISAIEASLTKGLNVIWGPPGTGKTDTSVYILGSELKMSQDAGERKRILITGPTKRAVAVILERLLGVFASLDQSRLRIICLSGTRSHDYDFILKDDWQQIESKAIGYGVNRVHGTGTLEDAYEKITDIRDMLSTAQQTSELIVVATHHHSISPLLTGVSINNKEPSTPYPSLERLFDFILVDESSQIDVADSLPILNTMDDMGRIVFAGDHLQMLPIQLAKIPKDAKHMTGSIQDYLITRYDINPSKLLTNYRSNDIIVNYGKRLGYPGELHAHNHSQRLECHPSPTRPLPGIFSGDMNEDAARIFTPEHSVVSIRYRDGISGQANPFEAMLTVNLIMQYYQRAADVPDFELAFWQTMVGVVTPHKAQRALVVKELCQIFPIEQHAHIDQAVDTVERFQGGERNMVIISFGVGDEDIIRQEEEFLLNLNRTNVSISRAKQQAVLLLSEELLQHLTADEDIAEQAKALKRYDHYCHNEKMIPIHWNQKQITLTYRWR